MSDFETEFDLYYQMALDVLHHSGLVEEVYAYINGIADDDYRNSTFSKMAAFLAERGNLVSAFM